MRYQAKFKVGGEVKNQLVNAETWVDAVNTLLTKIHGTKVQDIAPARYISFVTATDTIGRQCRIERRILQMLQRQLA
jgi:hypothetical protein